MSLASRLMVPKRSLVVKMRAAGAGLLAVALIFTINASASADDAVASNLVSHNWAGYSAQLPTGGSGFTAVSGSWTVPDLSNSTSNTYSGIWVGLDGFNSSTVEQIGILANNDPVNGIVYYPFYELYPDTSVNINQVLSTPIAISAGDVMSAMVTYNFTAGFRDDYTLSISDDSTSQSYSITIDTPTTNARSSAEWIVEAPLIGGQVASLVDFGSILFSDASVTLDADQTGVISDFPYTGIDLSAYSGLSAVAGPLDDTATSFTVTIVPEPVGLAMAALGALSLMARRRV